MSNVYVNLLNTLQEGSEGAFLLLNQSRELLKIAEDGATYVHGLVTYIQALYLIKCGIGLEIYSYIIFPNETLDEMKQALYEVITEIDLAESILHNWRG